MNLSRYSEYSFVFGQFLQTANFLNYLDHYYIVYFIKITIIHSLNNKNVILRHRLCQNLSQTT